MRNPPLHGVRIVGSNMIEVDHGEAYVLYSYETPVAVLLRTGPATDGPIITEKVWSRTTSKHIGTWLRDHGYSGARDPKVRHASQAEIERIAREGMRANPHEPYQPKTGARCSCRPGMERDNCPACEGTGWVIDFRAIRERASTTRRPMTPRHNPPEEESEASRHDPDEEYPDPGKFEGETWLAVQMYESSPDDEQGSVDELGWYGLFRDFEAPDGSMRHGILSEDGQGFVRLTEFDSGAEALDAFAEIVDEYEKFYEQQEEE